MSILTEIVEIIQLLEKREKKIFSEKSNTDALYYRLYLLLNNHRGSLDESDIRAQLGKDVDERSFFHAKGYLLKHLHQLLNTLHTNEYPKYRLTEQLRFCEILYLNGLYHQSLKYALRYKKECGGLELYDLYLQFLDLERKLNFVLPENTRLSQKASKIAADLNDTYIRLQQIQELDDIYRTIDQHIQVYGLIGRSTAVLLPTQERLAALSIPLHSVIAKAKFHNCQMLIHLANKEFVKAVAEATLLEELIQNNAEIWEATPERYISFFENLKRVYFFCDRHMDNLKLCDKVLAHISKADFPKGLYLKTLKEVYNTQLICFQHLDQWIDSKNAIKKIEDFALQFDQESNITDLFLLYNLAYGYFSTANYKMAFAYLRVVCNKPKNMFRLDLYIGAHMLYLMVLCSIKEWNLLEYNLASIQRFLKRNNNTLKTEELLIQFCRACLKTRNFPPKSILENYFKEAKVLEGLTKEQAATKFYCLSAWLRQLQDIDHLIAHN